MGPLASQAAGRGSCEKIWAPMGSLMWPRGPWGPWAPLEFKLPSCMGPMGSARVQVADVNGPHGLRSSSSRYLGCVHVCVCIQ